MKVKVNVLKKQISPSHYLTFEYEGEPDDSVAKLLRYYNEEALSRGDEQIAWECGCMINKCGACAMRINGVPRLACSSFLYEYEEGKIILEPLSKFPHVKDLITDRSAVFEALKRVNVYHAGPVHQDEKNLESRFESASCLNCGCCLEVCPNFNIKKNYTGAAAAVNGYRIAAAADGKAQLKEMRKAYAKHYYEGCGISLACHDICPAGIPVEDLISRSNAALVWGRRV